MLFRNTVVLLMTGVLLCSLAYGDGNNSRTDAVAVAQKTFDDSLAAAKREYDVKADLAYKAFIIRLNNLLQIATKSQDNDQMTQIAALIKVAEAKKEEGNSATSQPAAKPTPAVSTGTTTKAKSGAATTENFRFDDEKTIKKAWDLDGNWRIEKEGVRLDGGDTMLTTKGSYSGDFRIAIAYEMSDNCEIWVHIWGEQFAFKTSGNSVAVLERKGDVVTFASGKEKPTQVKLKEAEAAGDSIVKIHLDKRNLYRPRMELLIDKIVITGSTK